jgi:hypothetical protein
VCISNTISTVNALIRLLMILTITPRDTAYTTSTTCHYSKNPTKHYQKFYKPTHFLTHTFFERVIPNTSLTGGSRCTFFTAFSTRRTFLFSVLEECCRASKTGVLVFTRVTASVTLQTTLIRLEIKSSQTGTTLIIRVTE